MPDYSWSKLVISSQSANIRGYKDWLYGLPVWAIGWTNEVKIKTPQPQHLGSEELHYLSDLIRTLFTDLFVQLLVFMNFISGSAWESNQPIEVLARHTGFEVQKIIS